jgi:hypothetical protein
MVVVPRSAELQAEEDSLHELALVATVGGSKPYVSTAMIYAALYNRYEIRRDDVDIRGHEPEDFIARFRWREDRDRVLASRPWGDLMPLRWRLWTRMASGVVLVALRCVPAHARNTVTV